MDALTASLERSLQKISLNDNSSSSSSGGYVAAVHNSSASDSADNLELLNDSPLDLHSETPLPPFWEQCLDLKTGELYYINWRTGMKYQEDPRINPEIIVDSYSEGDSCSYDSEEGSSSESSYQTVDVSKEDRSRASRQYNNKNNIGSEINPRGSGQVLVVAGCKSCLMYFMVPKQENDCPKCYGQLLHF